MSRKKDMVLVAAGLLTGLALAGSAGAAVEYLTATRSACPIYVDGQKVELEAYMINDQNYVKLRDIGLSAPMIKCKKTPRKKCRIMAERREKR